MTAEAVLILNQTVRTERWEYPERGDYNLERLDREFRDGLYSDRGREILESQTTKEAQNTADQAE